MFGARMGAQMDENASSGSAFSPESRTAHFNDGAQVQSKERRLTRLGAKLGRIGADKTERNYPQVWEE